MNFCNTSPAFTAKDIPSLAGKVILVTGGNNGLGKQSILDLARHGPAEIWMGARNLDKARQAAEDIKTQLPTAPPIKLLKIDLESLDSVKQAAKTFLSQATRLDILMLNAGIMATPPGLTADGYEIQWATNYLGHALFTKLLLPLLEQTVAIKTNDVRIVCVSTAGFVFSPKGGIRFDTIKTTGDQLDGLQRYGQSKLAGILWAKQMARLYPQFTITSVNPGVVQTNLMAAGSDAPLALRLGVKVFYKFLKTAESGARPQLWAATADVGGEKGVKSGEYYDTAGGGGVVSEYWKDDGDVKKVWEWTERELKGHFN